MSSIPHRSRLFLVLPLLLTACGAAQEEPPTDEPRGEDPDITDPGGNDDDPDLSLRWTRTGHVPTLATQFAVSSGHTFVLSEDGFFEHDGSGWSSLNDEVGPVEQVMAVDGAVAVATMEGLFLRPDGEANFSRVTELGEGWVFLASGESGIYSSSSLDDQAYQVWPEFRQVGSAFSVLFSSCSNLVSDGQLDIFSMDVGEWLAVPLPEPEADIFEFAATSTEWWVFGAGSLWRGSADGTNWSEVIWTPGLNNHKDVRQHGDAILSGWGTRIGWTVDGGDDWSILESPYGYTQWTTSDGYLYSLPEAFVFDPEIDDTVLRRASLHEGADSDQAYLELPPAPLYTPRITEAGQVLVTSQRGTSLFSDGAHEETYGVFGSWLLDAVLVEDENAWVEGASDVWYAVGRGWAGAPIQQTVGELGLTQAWAGWPTSGVDALALAYTPMGMMACTGSASGEDTAGAGVLGLDISDSNWATTGWSEVGSDFPLDGEHLAPCSDLFYVDDGLVASTTVGAVRLTTDGVWQGIEGLDGVTSLVETEAGLWALTPQGLAFSEEGWTFALVDDTVAGAERLFALDERLVVLQGGSLWLGGPGDWDASQWTEDEDIADLDVRDGLVLAVTVQGQAWTATLD